LLVAGPFIADRIDRVRPWVGSTNQEFVLLTDRIAGSVEELWATPDQLEILVGASGRIAVNGWATPDVLDQLLTDLDARPRSTPPSRRSSDEGERSEW